MRRAGTPQSKKYNLGRVDNDWSPRHVRLRFEMMLASLIFFLVTKYGAKEFNLPFIKFDNPIDGQLVVLPALAIAIFSLISFLTRSEYEKALWPKQELITRREIKIFSEEFDDLKSNAVNFEYELGDNAEEFYCNVFARKDEYRQYSYTLENFSTFLSDLHEENGFNSPVHPKFWAKVASQFARIVEHSNTIRSLSNDLTFQHGAYSIQGYKLEALPSKIIEQQNKIRILLKNVAPEINERVRALYRHSAVRWFQTQFLSVLIPSLSASALLALGSYSLLGCVK